MSSQHLHITRFQVCNSIQSGLLCLLAAAIPTSNYVMNIAWIFLLANWIVQGNFSAKWQRMRSNRLLQAVVVLFALHIIGMLWTTNIDYGINDIRQKLPLLCIPLVILSSAPLSPMRWHHIRMVFVSTAFTVCIIGVVRFLTIPDLPYRDLNPWISHIRFSLVICFAICLLIDNFFNAEEPLRLMRLWRVRIRRRLGMKSITTRPVTQKQIIAFQIICAGITIFFLAFLMLQQSYTAAVVLLIMGIIIAIASKKRIIIGTILVLVLAVIGTSAYFIHDYYSLQSLSTEPLLARTENGNPYFHNQDGFIESGGYINNYICDEELYREWSKRSSIHPDSISIQGYAVKGALIRYLNSLNLTKDSAGVCQLTDNDVAAIERGIANPNYLKQGSLRKFFSQLLYEYETARHHGSIRDFTMLERFELWSNGWNCIKEHPIIGVGTGDAVDVEHARLKEIGSTIADTKKHIHNQYLTFILTFGFLGFAILVFFFARAICKGGKMPMLHLAFVVMVLISFISEDTIETLAGISLVALWGSLLYSRRNSSHTTS